MEQRRDRDGEIFENDLTEENIPAPAEREPAEIDDDMKKTDMDEQTGDEFMREQFGSGKGPGPDAA